jgi:predicted GNAT family N-acyltransferase
MSEFVYRQMRTGEEQAVADLAARVFNHVVAPHYADEGVQEFLRYASADRLRDRLQADHFVLVAEERGELVGLIEVRHSKHVAMMFVTRPGRGVGKELLRRAIARCRQAVPELARVTVHAAPGAVEIYARFGFQALEPERVQNGIRFVPMALELDDALNEPGGDTA